MTVDYSLQQHDQKEGQEKIDQELDQKKQLRKKQLNSVLHRAVDLLSRREHSAEELKTKLQQKGFELNDVEQTIIRLQNENLQSDDRFTESFTNERKRRGHGPVKIQHQLRQKGINDQLIEQYIDAQDEKWIHLAQLQYQKKYADKEVNDYNEWTKRARFLQGRGFTSAQIRATVTLINEVD